MIPPRAGLIIIAPAGSFLSVVELIMPCVSGVSGNKQMRNSVWLKKSDHP